MKGLILLGSFFSIILFNGCRKELPPLRCNKFTFIYNKYGTSPDIDSIKMTFIRRGDFPENESKVFRRDFFADYGYWEFEHCGAFEYSLKVYHNGSGIKYNMEMLVNGGYDLFAPHLTNKKIRDNQEIHGEFIY